LTKLENEMFELGRTYRDLITGFTGVATGHVRYISGCNQVLLQPPVDKEGKLREPQWFDEQRLEVKGTKAIVLDNSETPGFDAPAPKR
jgi:hypothetical protein